MSIRLFFSDHWVALLELSVFFSLILSSVHLVGRQVAYEKELPTVNRSFALEPGIFARFRWAFKSPKILDDAYKKVSHTGTLPSTLTESCQCDGQVYRIARGDVDMVVVPVEFIPELNRLPQNMINSRMCHAYSMIGHLNGMNVVLETQLHVKTLLQRISPALPELLKPASARIGETINNIFPQETVTWSTVEPIDKVVYCVSRVMSLASVGTPVCDDPDLIRLTFEHTKHGT